MSLYKMPPLLPESMSEKERTAVMREVGAKAEEEFQRDYFKLGEWFERFDALFLLSYCALYFVSHPEGTDPEAEGTLDFYEHYLELLQAFALTRKRSPSAEHLGDEANGLHELMERLGLAMSFRGFAKMDENSAERRRQSSVLSSMRIQTQAVRNWGYADHMKSVTGDLAATVRDEFIDGYGVDPVRLLDTLLSMAQTADDRLNDHLNRAREFYRQGNYTEVASAYIEAFPDTADFDPEELFDFCGRKLKNFKNLLLMHTDLRLSEIYTFDIDDIATTYGETANKKALKTIFDELSMEFGTLHDRNVEHFILDNPVLTKPFIKVDQQTYYSAVIGLMPHCSLRILEQLIQSLSSLEEKYRYRKGRYLEDELENLFRESFPNGKVYRGSTWDNEEGINGENDLTVIVDCVAIVVEAKSGMATPPASRGAPDRFSRTVRELIDNPAEQAHNFIALLKSQRGPVAFLDGNGGINRIDTTGVRYFIPLTVTLENLGSVSNLRDLVEAGISRRQLHELSSVISLTDLMVIFEILDLQSQRIHYLARRREFDAHVRYHGDELDILAFYLDHGLNIGEIEYSANQNFMLSPLSKQLDPYFVAKSSGLSIEKPSLALTPTWRAMLTRMDMALREHWLDASLILLNVPFQDQRKVERGLQRLSRKVKRGKAKMRHNWTTVVTAPHQRQFYAAFYPYIGLLRDERNAIIEDILDQKEARESRGAICIGLDLNHPEVPYAILAARPSPNLFDELL